MKIPDDRRWFDFNRRTLLFALCVLGIPVVVYAFWPKRPQATEFMLASPVTARINTTIHAYGSLQPKTRYSIISQINGNVEQIHLRPGDVAKAGEIIITLSNPKLTREAEKAQLEWLAEQANLQKLQAGQLNAISVQQSQVKLAQYELALAENRLKANKTVYQQQVISRLDLQQTELAYEKARLTLADLQQLQQTLQTTHQAELTAYQYILQRAEKQYELLQNDIRHLEIRAGIDGLVNKLNTDLEEGQSVEAGTGLGQLADPTSLYAQLRVQASDITMLANQQVVEINIKDQMMAGVVQRISPQVDNATVEVDVRLTESLPANAMSNMAISAIIRVQAKQPSLLLKKPPHIKHAGPNVLLIAANKDGDATDYQPRQVQIGWVGTDQIEVLDGLTSSDSVVLADPAQFGMSQHE
ncbi:MAG: HlyD family efflux transporter periplasmic adaptor subunit [Gammaproteobacteria bacterium]|nr:HlyD family efflux transporter periplasmic adaptor subunit [Gammaproteobacteria bacterium]